LIRITELSLPLGDPLANETRHALRRSILRRLQIDDSELVDFEIFKRSHDARRKDREIAFVYIVDVTVRNESAVLGRFPNDRNVTPAPDTQFSSTAARTRRRQSPTGRGRLRALRSLCSVTARARRPSPDRSRTRT
jgi:uncharacterized FAD-dependent dehydrogenase